jgi:hypothetical protein
MAGRACRSRGQASVAFVAPILIRHNTAKESRGNIFKTSLINSYPSMRCSSVIHCPLSVILFHVHQLTRELVQVIKCYTPFSNELDALKITLISSAKLIMLRVEITRIW